MLESLKKFEGSSLQDYIEERARYWDCAAQLTQNRMVSQIAATFDSLKERKFSNIGELKDFCEQGSRPTTDPATFNIGRIAALVSVLEFLDDKPWPQDAFQFLSKVAERRKVLESRRATIKTRTIEDRREARRRAAAKQGNDINPIGGAEPKEPEKFLKRVSKFVNPFEVAA